MSDRNMSTEQVTRYDLVTNYPMGEPWNEIEEQLDGDYVLWKDYKELRERNAWLENYVKACENEIKRAYARTASDVPEKPFVEFWKSQDDNTCEEIDTKQGTRSAPP